MIEFERGCTTCGPPEDPDDVDDLGGFGLPLRVLGSTAGSRGRCLPFASCVCGARLRVFLASVCGRSLRCRASEWPWRSALPFFMSALGGLGSSFKSRRKKENERRTGLGAVGRGDDSLRRPPSEYDRGRNTLLSPSGAETDRREAEGTKRLTKSKVSSSESDSVRVLETDAALAGVGSADVAARGDRSAPPPSGAYFWSTKLLLMNPGDTFGRDRSLTSFGSSISESTI